ncbi:type I methionyl aminopeptidase [bacterium]|nr:type I methionyl aminopeptidase [bacterium]
MIEIKTPEEIEKMAECGRITRRALDEVGAAVRPGVRTSDLDALAENIIRSEGAEPAFKGYFGFPATICASVNCEVVHGIPGPGKVLKEGDILSVDVGVRKFGFHGDAARTFPVGKISETARRLCDVTRASLEAGIAQAVAGNRVEDISRAVQTAAESAGFSVVREWVGHGVGRNLHEDPQVPNFVTGKKGPVLAAGMTLAIEPMLNVGTHKTEILADKWTVVTADRQLSAHFENTIAVTANGPRVLT